MKFEKMVSTYIQLRDKKKELDDAHKEVVRPYNDAMEKLELAMLAMLQQTGQDSARTGFGTVYKTTKHNVSIADKDAFRRHVIGGEAWELLDWKANSTAVQALVSETGQPPPGVNYSSHLEVGVRRPNGK